MATQHSPADDIVYNLLSASSTTRSRRPRPTTPMCRMPRATTMSGRFSSSAPSKTPNARRSATSYSDSSPATVG